MDPNEILATLRRRIESVWELGGEAPDDLFFLAEDFANLDKWLSSGGFLPAAWTKNEH